MRNAPSPERAALKGMIEAGRRMVVFTGAGISTESGIPDFRSPGGFWSNHRPIEFSDFLASEEMRRESWRRKVAFEEEYRSAVPNRGHRAVARLVELGKVTSVVTQNIDGLHQASGIADSAIIELHGNGTYAVCLSCLRRYDLTPILQAFKADETLPTCGECGGIIKTGTISFGQPMPEEAMRRAERATRDCDLFLVAGSSLVVYPAAGFPALAKRAGARLVIVNREPTDLDSIADLVVREPIGPAFGEAAGVD